MPTNLLIATPTYPDRITSACHTSLMNLAAWCHSNGVSYKPMCIDLHGTDTARNVFASLAYQDNRFTHVLFWDNDMEARPDLVGRALKIDRPIVGYVCPKRTIDLARLHETAKTENDLAKAIAAASEFSFHSEEELNRQDFEAGEGEVRAIGMGITLIQRSVFARMVATGKLRSYVQPEAGGLGLTGALYGFFDRLADGNRMLEEDFSFCERARQLCGIKTWAIWNEDIGHSGSFIFRATAANLKRGP